MWEQKGTDTGWRDTAATAQCSQLCAEGMRDDWKANLLAGQLVNTVYEVTVSSIDAVGFLRVVAAPCMTHTWRRGCGGH